MNIVDSIKFRPGDTVCIKERYDCPLGEVSNNLTDITPYKVIGISTDRHWDNRVGLEGDCHSYQLESCFVPAVTINKFQYELQFWSEVKPRVLEAHRQRLADLEGIV